MNGKKGSEMDDVKRIDIKEFQELGFLQEVNRLFFHPLGLALEVVIEDECEMCGGTGRYMLQRGGEPTKLCPECEGSKKRPKDKITYRLGGVWDYRDDPEGIIYDGDYLPELEKAVRVAEEKGKHEEARIKLIGSVVQVIEGPGFDGKAGVPLDQAEPEPDVVVEGKQPGPGAPPQPTPGPLDPPNHGKPRRHR